MPKSFSVCLLTLLGMLSPLSHSAVAQSPATGALIGYLDAITICGTRHSREARECEVQYSLALPGNRVVPLALEEERTDLQAAASSLLGQPVVVEGEPVFAELAGEPTIQVRSLRPHPGVRHTEALPTGQFGRKPYIVIRVRFADTRRNTPSAANRIATQFRLAAPGLGHYFRTLSYGQMNLDGTRVLDWVNLRKPRSAYRSNGGVNMTALLADAVAAVDAQVHFPDYYGIMLVPNANPYDSNGPIGIGGDATRTYDGVFRRWGFVFLGRVEQELIAHETLHSLGVTQTIPHSSGPYKTVYDSRWDVLSRGGTGRKQPPFGHIAAETIAHHRNLLGWIPTSSQVVASPAGRTLVNLSFLSGGSIADHALVVQIPLNTQGTLFYTVEARRRAGLYDRKIPYTCVLIHQVNSTRRDRQAQVVDRSRNGNPNDKGAAWTPGETFVDAKNGVRVQVVRRLPQGFQVLIQRSG